MFMLCENLHVLLSPLIKGFSQVSVVVLKEWPP